MLHLHLTDTQRIELQALRRTNLPAVFRSRLEMILLFDLGWSAPRIATPPLSPARHPGRPQGLSRSRRGCVFRGRSRRRDWVIPQGLSRSRRGCVHSRVARPRTGSRPPRAGHRTAGRTPWPGPYLDQPTTRRGPSSRRRNHRPSSGSSILGPVEGRIPTDRPSRRPPTRPEEGRTGRTGPRRIKKSGRWSPEAVLP